MKRVALVLTAVAFLVSAAAARIAERIVAKVNRDIITLTELEDMVETAMSESGKAPGNSESAQVTEQVLERMITDRLIIQAGLAQGLKATESEVEPHVDRELDAVRSRFATAKEFMAQLKREGITLSELKARYQRQMKDRFIYLKMMGRKQRELGATIEIPDAAVEKYFEANRNREEWQLPARIHARHIQVSVDRELTGKKREAALAEAHERLKAARAALGRGEPFEDVARSLSDDFTTREKGGDLGVFARGTYHATMENAAFALKQGSLSPDVESPVGVHIIQVTELLSPRPRTLDDPYLPADAGQIPGAPAPEEKPLREHIRDILLNERLAAELQVWVDELKRGALIERFLQAPAGVEDEGI